MNKKIHRIRKHSLLLIAILCLLGSFTWLAIHQPKPVSAATAHPQALPKSLFPAPVNTSPNPLSKQITGILFDRNHPENSAIMVRSPKGDLLLKNHSNWGSHGKITVLDDTHVLLQKGKQSSQLTLTND